ncbi:hypothetical protein CONLIGDRAFT_637736 [Coniochaeta ligniaria NRRL 30616]|uniref:Uncharacterized protein n=1 Tax=Coniochaeta ligniaria NRRL 30616 TaxID=1408157 RepID=A0A1J7I6P1_9PEZI|nr:hypothetical protein CONLIGDRAFT_637736 [Coniochaeta ligniaria NRRL 30616]
MGFTSRPRDKVLYKRECIRAARGSVLDELDYQYGDYEDDDGYDDVEEQYDEDENEQYNEKEDGDQYNSSKEGGAEDEEGQDDKPADDKRGGDKVSESETKHHEEKKTAVKRDDKKQPTQKRLEQKQLSNQTTKKTTKQLNEEVVVRRPAKIRPDIHPTASQTASNHPTATQTTNTHSPSPIESVILPAHIKKRLAQTTARFNLSFTPHLPISTDTAATTTQGQLALLKEADEKVTNHIAAIFRRNAEMGAFLLCLDDGRIYTHDGRVVMEADGRLVMDFGSSRREKEKGRDLAARVAVPDISLLPGPRRRLGQVGPSTARENIGQCEN